jgi:hypothetical protein
MTLGLPVETSSFGIEYRAREAVDPRGCGPRNVRDEILSAVGHAGIRHELGAIPAHTIIRHTTVVSRPPFPECGVVPRHTDGSSRPALRPAAFGAVLGREPRRRGRLAGIRRIERKYLLHGERLGNSNWRWPPDSAPRGSLIGAKRLDFNPKTARNSNFAWIETIFSTFELTLVFLHIYSTE